MLHNYLKIAVRNLVRNWLFSLINMVGMAIGMCVCFFALLWVSFELSYDRYHEKADRTYRLVTDIKTATGTEYASSTGAMAPAIQAAFPEVTAATRVFLDYLIIQKDQNLFSEEPIAYADSSLFSVFTFPLIHGNPRTALNAPLTVVLSETAARKYFGSGNPVGNTLLINGKDLATVTGVMADMPYNSQFRVDILVSMATLGNGWTTNWKRFFYYTYLVLPETTNPAQLSAKITNLVKQHTDQQQASYTVALEPLTSVYLHGKPRGSRSGSAVTGSLTNVYIFSLIAVFVLFIASFNFINLTTALATKRAKEIGVRKSLGAARSQLVGQLLLDSVLLNLIAFGLALIMCSLLLPVVNDLSGKVISTSLFQRSQYVWLLLTIALLVSLLSGLYPALSLSGFAPLQALKGKFMAGVQGGSLRKALVVSQFSLSIILISATIVVYTQLNYMRTHELGFRKDHKLVVDFQFDDRVIDHSQPIKQRLGRLPGVSGISLSSSIPGRANHDYPTKLENRQHGLQELQADAYFIDHDFLQQYGVSLVAGRALSPQLASDSTEAMLINEAAVKSLGYSQPQQALGKRFQQLNRTGVIVGVIRDFHFQSLQEKVQPLTLRIAPGFFTFMTLNLSTTDMPETIGQLRREWQALVPDMPLVYFFADDVYDAQYRAEDNFGRLFICLAVVAIFISCLGLLGLSVFSTVQRTKEIGVRKVLGATVLNIITLLSKDFLKLVLIAIVIATPVAWYAMNRWLQDFAYKISIEWWMFAGAGLLAIGIALLTVSVQSVKAALMNPVKSLRSE